MVGTVDSAVTVGSSLEKSVRLGKTPTVAACPRWAGRAARAKTKRC